MNWKAFIILRSIIIFKGAKRLFILWLISKPLMNFEFLKSRVKLKLREIEFWKPISRKNAVQMGQTFVSTLNLLCFVLFEEKSFNLKVSPKPSSNSASDCKQNDYILCSTRKKWENRKHFGRSVNLKYKFTKNIWEKKSLCTNSTLILLLFLFVETFHSKFMKTS